jgi:hypothetical protein
MKTLQTKKVNNVDSQNQSENYFLYNNHSLNGNPGLNEQSEWLQPLTRTNSKCKELNSQTNNTEIPSYNPFEGVEHDGNNIDYIYRKLFGYSFSSLIARSMKNYIKNRNFKPKQLSALYRLF